MEQNNFIILRHSYDDHSYIDGKNDTGLTKKGIEMIENASYNILQKIIKDHVIIRHSTKLRAKQTAEILGDFLLKNNIKCDCISDIGLTELFQGNFNFGQMEHHERVAFLQSCWDDFETCRKEGNLTHHFGQNKSRNIVLQTGENHLEWSIRIAKGVLNILDDMQKPYQLINITHRGAIFEIQNIIKMINGQIPLEEVEQYETIWMPYCQDYSLAISNVNNAKILIKKYIEERKKNENNY